MKNIFKIIFVMALMFSLNVNSQNIIVRGENNGNLPQDFLTSGQYYYKDIHNYLNNFVGTWEYINGNEKFQIILTKVVQYHYISNKTNSNYYEDGIILQYRKYINNNLVFESPTYNNPNFISTDGILLKGHISDYGRISKTVYYPFGLTDKNGNNVYVPGGEPIYPHCRISKIPNEPNKVFFNLDLTGTMNYDKETYVGQPTYSIPNNVIMTKVN